MSEPEIIKFGGGLPDPHLVPPLADLFDAVLHTDPQAFTYDLTHLGGGGVWGHEPLREAVAGRISVRSGIALSAHNVIMTNGAAGALEMVAMNFMGQGTVVAVEELTYPAALKIFRRQGARIVTVPLDGEGLRVDVLNRMLEGDQGAVPSVLYTIATAQSPTATTLATDRRRELASMADRSGLTIVQDDTYGEVIFETDPPQPFIGLVPDRTIHVGSFSKTLAPGLRLGWLTARSDVCEAIARERTDLGQTPIVQYVVGRLLAQDRFDPHLAGITKAYREKRDVLVNALHRHCTGLATWTVPSAGFFLWITLMAGDVREVERCGMEEGVAFLSGPHFSAGEINSTGIRLAYSELSIHQLEEGVRRLARAINRALASSDREPSPT